MLYASSLYSLPTPWIETTRILRVDRIVISDLVFIPMRRCIPLHGSQPYVTLWWT
jgi:hypothetical protein